MFSFAIVERCCREPEGVEAQLGLKKGDSPQAESFISLRQRGYEHTTPQRGVKTQRHGALSAQDWLVHATLHIERMETLPGFPNIKQGRCYTSKTWGGIISATGRRIISGT